MTLLFTKRYIRKNKTIKNIGFLMINNKKRKPLLPLLAV